MRHDFLADNTLEPNGVQAELDRLDSGRGSVPRRLSLAFAGNLEPAFLRHRAESVVTLQRLAMLIGMLLYSAYFTHDYLTARKFSDPQVWGLMVAFAVPGNLALFIATFLRESWRYTLIGRASERCSTPPACCCSAPWRRIAAPTSRWSS